MVSVYSLEKINLGDSSQTGHVVYKKATIQETADGPFKKIVYKENKNSNPNFSCLEVAFTGLARRFLARDLIPQQRLVKNQQDKIVGVASEHFSYAAYRREKECSDIFYEVKSIFVNQQRETLIETPAKKVNAAEEVPIYFFNDFPSGFFATLWRARQQRKLTFDMVSLASVLAGSYTLEEEDLHKGNLGFYIVGDEGKKKVVFFKIDNDLMMADSVMSHCGSRLFNIHLGEHAFDITQRDLLSFPKLLDSSNYYWPTSKPFFASPFGNKSYSGFDEIAAFSELAKSTAFQRAKWFEFYRHILIPPAQIAQGLAQAYDATDPASRAEFALILQAVIARQARLRAVLFTIPEFRQFVRGLTQDEKDLLQEEILDGLPNEAGQFEAKLRDNFNRYAKFCQPEGGFVAGDTPLHVAIRLQDYRYNETWKSFHSFADQANAKGEKPLDVAVALAKQVQASQSSIDDIRQDPFSIIKSLRKKGVKARSYNQLDEEFKKNIRIYQFNSIHHRLIDGTVNDSQGLIGILRGLGEDYRFCLKMKKKIAMDCVRKFITEQRDNPELSNILTGFKEALNRAPELQFIRQLRSRLWIVRKIRGLLGGTSTQVQLNELIDTELKRLSPPPPPSCFSFFSPALNDKPRLQISEPQNCRYENGLNGSK
jgi:hypothetical protein